MVKSTIALFLLEVISKSIREHEKNEDMFEFIYDSLCALDSDEKLNPDFHLLFLVHFSRYLGFSPHENYSEKMPFFEMSEGVFTDREDALSVLDKKDSKLLFELLQANPLDTAEHKMTRK